MDMRKVIDILKQAQMDSDYDDMEERFNNAIAFLENNIKLKADKVDMIREKLFHIFDKTFNEKHDGVLQLCREINVLLDSLEDK